MATFAPKLYEKMFNYMEVLYGFNNALKPNFRGYSTLPACSFNLGPRTVTNNHLDNLNMAHGLCCITALGDFKYRKDALFILFVLKKAVRFRPGCTIIIPSSVIEHGNTAMNHRGIRLSFTQYFPGNIIHFVDYGCATGTDLLRIGGEHSLRRQAVDEKEAERLQDGIGRFSKFVELEKDRRDMFQTPNEVQRPISLT